MTKTPTRKPASSTPLTASQLATATGGGLLPIPLGSAPSFSNGGKEIDVRTSDSIWAYVG